MEEETGLRTVEKLKLVHYTKDKSVARLSLQRPPYNVMNITLLEELGMALDAVDLAGDVKLVIIAGNDQAFSGGLDLADLTHERAYQLLEAFHGVFRKLLSLEAVTMALVKGMALGGGCELAASCDFTFVAEDAKMGQPEVKVGIFPPIAAALFPQLVGRHRAFELIFSGDVFTGRDAERLGLATRAIPAAQVDAEAQRWIDRFDSLSVPVVQLTRKALADASAPAFEEALRRVEEIYLNYLMATEDAQEGLKAFLEKRKPTWKHR